MAKIVLQTDYQPSDVAIFADPAAYMDTLTQPSQYYYDYGVNFNPAANEYAYIRVWLVSNATALLHENSPCIHNPFSDPAVSAYYCIVRKVRNDEWGTGVINGPYATGSFLTTF